MVQHRSTLFEVVSVLRDHRRWIALSFAVLMGATILTAFFLPRTYSSEAQLLVRIGRENTRVDPTTTLGDSTTRSLSIDSREHEINTVAAILTNRNLLEQVVRAVGPERLLDRDPSSSSFPATTKLTVVANVESNYYQNALVPTLGPEAKAVKKLKEDLIVEAVRNTNLVDIKFCSHDPKVAQEVISQLVELYLDEHMRLYRTPGAHKFLSEQTDVMRERLMEAEKQLRDRKRETGLIALEEQREALVTRIATLQNQLETIQAAVVENETHVKQLQELMAGLSRTEITTESTGNDNPAADGMRQQLYALQLKEQELSAIYTDNHVKVHQIRDQVAAAKKVLAAEEDRRIEKTRELSRPYEEAQVQLLEKKPLLAAIRAKSKKVAVQLVEAKKALNKFNEDQVRLAELERTVAIHDHNYRIYATDTEQARIDHALNSARMTNISVVQPATLNIKPSFPNLNVIGFLGLSLALSGSIGSAFVVEHVQKTEHERKGMKAS